MGASRIGSSFARAVKSPHRLSTIKDIDYPSVPTGPTMWWGRIPADRAQEWDRVVGGRSAYMSSRYLRAMEGHAKVEFRFAVWQDLARPVGNQIMGVAVFQRVQVESRAPAGHLKMGWIMRRVNSILHPGGRPFTFWVWLAGQALASGPHAYAFEPGLEEPQAAARVDAAFRELSFTEAEAGRPRVAAWMLKDQLPDADIGLCRMRRRGWVKLTFDPVMVVPLESTWHQLEDWMDALRTKARTRVKSILQRSDRVELREFDAEQAEEMSAILYGLYCAVYDRASVVMGGLEPGDFSRLKRELGDDFRLIAYRCDGRWVGFQCGICEPGTGTIEAYFVGFEPSINKELGLYQRMLVEFVRWGLERGARRVIMGRTALEIKSGMGALPVQLTLAFRFRHPALRVLMLLGSGLFVPKPFVPRRAWRNDAAVAWEQRGPSNGYG